MRSAWLMPMPEKFGAFQLPVVQSVTTISRVASDGIERKVIVPTRFSCAEVRRQTLVPLVSRTYGLTVAVVQSSVPPLALAGVMSVAYVAYVSASARSAAKALVKLIAFVGAPNIVVVGWPVLRLIEPVPLVGVIVAVPPLRAPVRPVPLTTRAYWLPLTVTLPPANFAVPPT